MNEQKFLESVRSATITPKMQKAINTQVARFFVKANDYVIDFELYNKIDDYKSFTQFEKAIIAYRACDRLSEVGIYEDDFLCYWYKEGDSPLVKTRKKLKFF